MKFTLLTPALAAILGFALISIPVTTQAQTPEPTTPAAPAKVKPTSYKGSLTAVSASSVTVQETTEPLILAIDAKTKILVDKKKAAITDFAVGDNVTGSYLKDETTGTMTAHSLYKKTAPAAK